MWRPLHPPDCITDYGIHHASTPDWDMRSVKQSGGWRALLTASLTTMLGGCIHHASTPDSDMKNTHEHPTRLCRLAVFSIQHPPFSLQNRRPGACQSIQVKSRHDKKGKNTWRHDKKEKNTWRAVVRPPRLNGVRHLRGLLLHLRVAQFLDTLSKRPWSTGISGKPR